MNDYPVRQIDIGTYGVWSYLLLIAGMIIAGLTICAHADELQVDYNSGGITAVTPIWSEREIIVKFISDIPEDDENAVIQLYGCSTAGRCSFTGLRLV